MEYARKLDVIRQLYGADSVEYMLWRTGGKYCLDGKGHRSAAYMHEDIDSGSIQADRSQLPEGWIHLYDAHGNNWTGPERTAFERLRLIPNANQRGGGWGAVWKTLPEELVNPNEAAAA